ncbi:hypothetical protein EDB89DRAFT_2074365 [Lactarius sanguifluus]|nr:hypothetical protein EDB89DRAFT_2074365 [Lactarius sanguifluus]
MSRSSSLATRKTPSEPRLTVRRHWSRRRTIVMLLFHFSCSRSYPFDSVSIVLVSRLATILLLYPSVPHCLPTYLSGRLVASVSPLSRCVIVSEVKPYRGHLKDIASHLVVALPRLAASDGIATCLVLVSPIHARSRPRPFAFAPALAVANAPDSASLLFTSEALLIYEVPWTKLLTFALHTSPSLPLSGTSTPSHTSLALAGNDVLIHSPPAFDHAHSLFQDQASRGLLPFRIRVLTPATRRQAARPRASCCPCPSTPRLLRIAHITCPFQDVKIVAHPLPLSLATHKTPLEITRSVALTVGGFSPFLVLVLIHYCSIVSFRHPYLISHLGPDRLRASSFALPMPLLPLYLTLTPTYLSSARSPSFTPLISANLSRKSGPTAGTRRIKFAGLVSSFLPLSSRFHLPSRSRSGLGLPLSSL